MGLACTLASMLLGNATAYAAVADDDSAALIPTLLRAQADGVSTRADFSRVQLTYLGRDRVLAFNQWTGDHSLWQFERDGLTKCDPFTWPPLSTGRWASLRYTEFIFAGFTQLISLDPRAGTLTLTECDEDAFLPRCRGKALRCNPLFTAALEGRGPGHELTYLGQDLLLHYERSTGRYALLTFRRGCDAPSAAADANATARASLAPRCALSAPLSRGKLPVGAYHSYLGGDYVLAFLPRRTGGTFELYRVSRSDDDRAPAPELVGDAASGEAVTAAPPSAPPSPVLERVGGGTLNLNGSFTDSARRHRLLPLHGGLLLDYDKESAAYRLLDLMTPSGVRTERTPSEASSRAGSILFSTLSARTIPSSATEGCAALTTVSACQGAASAEGCGWCQASGRCVRGDAWGPCRRAACSGENAGCGAWHSPAGSIRQTDPGHASHAPSAVAAAATLDGAPAVGADADVVILPSAPTAAAECTACAGGGMGLRGGAATAIYHCAKCAAAAAPPVEAAADGSSLSVPLPKAAIRPAGGAAFRLAAFVLAFLQSGPCARLGSPLCATILEGTASRVTAASVSAPPAALALGASGTPPPTGAVLDVSITCDIARMPTAPSAAFDAFVTAPHHLAPADPDSLSMRVLLHPPTGLDTDNGTLVLTALSLSLANGDPATALPSPITTPLPLSASHFAAFATPAVDAAAASHALTPLAGTYPHRPIHPLAFDSHELTYLGYVIPAMLPPAIASRRHAPPAMLPAIPMPSLRTPRGATLNARASPPARQLRRHPRPFGVDGPFRHLAA